MPDKLQLIDLSAIKSSPVHDTPYPYTLVDQAFLPAHLDALGQNYPLIEDAGSFPLTSITYGAPFAQLIAELKSDAFRNVLAEKFAIDLTDKPVMITVRGKADENDGKIHTDSKTKLITVLLYMNEDWQDQEGQLRLLYDNHNLDHYAAEVSPRIGTMLIFKVTPHGWHGHKTFIGTRKVIQLNYVTHEKALTQHARRHRLSAFFKHWRRKLLGKKSHACADC